MIGWCDWMISLCGWMIGWCDWMISWCGWMIGWCGLVIGWCDWMIGWCSWMSWDTKSCKVLGQKETDYPFQELSPTQACPLADLRELVSFLCPDFVMELVV